MRKMMILMLAAAFTLISAASHTTIQAKDEADEPEDYFQLYRYAGRKWTLKRTPKPGQEGGDDEVTYHHFEVQNVWEDRVEYTQTTLNAARKDDSDNAFRIKLDFDRDATVFKDPIGMNRQKREKVKTPAGTFDCVLWYAPDTFDGEARLWRSVEFPSLIVKQDDRFSTRELTEFTWVEGESGHKAKGKKRRKKKDDKPEEIEPQRLFSNKRALWIHKTVIEKGERKHKSFDVTQYEIKRVSKEECTLEISKLTQLYEKIKDEEVIEKTIKFDDSLQDHLKPEARAKVERTEKRITEVGLYECTVYTYKDDEGRDVTEWYAKEWPGLVVRRLVEGELYKALTEIVKFEN